MGAQPKEFLPDRVDELIQMLADSEDTWAGGAALYAPGGGMFDNQRKANLATIKMVLRENYRDKGIKASEALIDDAAHADKRYIAFLDKHVVDRAKWLTLHSQRQQIEMKIKMLTYTR